MYYTFDFILFVQGNPSKLPVVSVTDTGSKYGTFINDGIKSSSRLAKDCTVILSDGDHIRFGLQWNEWR
jgi:pSer/pThr/pTyr-binding forkhead associated (FHA) protein